MANTNKPTNRDELFLTLDELFCAGYDVDILQYFEGFDAWLAARLEEAGSEDER